MPRRADGRAGVLEYMLRPAAHADLGDKRQDDIFGRYTRRQVPVHPHFAGFRFSLQQALRCQHMLHFRCADAKRQRPKGSMCGRVTVAADDGHTRVGVAQFRSDHVDDAALGAVHAIQIHTELGRVDLDLLDLGCRQRVRNRQGWVMRRDGMVHRGDGLFRSSDLESALAQTREGLR